MSSLVRRLQLRALRKGKPRTKAPRFTAGTYGRRLYVSSSGATRHYTKSGPGRL